MLPLSVMFARRIRAGMGYYTVEATFEVPAPVIRRRHDHVGCRIRRQISGPHLPVEARRTATPARRRLLESERFQPSEPHRYMGTRSGRRTGGSISWVRPLWRPSTVKLASSDIRRVSLHQFVPASSFSDHPMIAQLLRHLSPREPAVHSGRYGTKGEAHRSSSSSLRFLDAGAVRYVLFTSTAVRAAVCQKP